MRVIDINGRLATAGSWDETSQSEATAQARLRATRTGLRAMLAGNEAFHVDPMAAPAYDCVDEVMQAFEQAPAEPEVEHGGRGISPGCRVRVLPHPAGVRHPLPFIERMDRFIGQAGGVFALEASGSISVKMPDGALYYFPPSSLVVIESEADTPAPAAQESAKRVIRMGPRCWRIASSQGPYGCAHDYTCDADGWISHTPTADAVCPVPEGIEFEARWPNGGMSSLPCEGLRTECAIAWSTKGSGGLSAWRPIQA